MSYQNHKSFLESARARLRKKIALAEKREKEAGLTFEEEEWV